MGPQIGPQILGNFPWIEVVFMTPFVIFMAWGAYVDISNKRKANKNKALSTHNNTDIKGIGEW